MHVAVYLHACGHSSTCMLPWICVHMAMYPCAHGSRCRWLCIHAENFLMCYVHIAVYPRAGGHVSMWSCIHIYVAVSTCRIWQNFTKRYGRQHRILVCSIGHFTELCSLLWSTVQNFIKRYGPPSRMIYPNADLHELYLKACPNLERNSWADICTCKNHIIKSQHHSYLNPSLLRNKINSALWATVQIDFQIQISRRIWSWIRYGFNIQMNLDRLDSWRKKNQW
jgi:hypothetical protein